MHREGAEMAFTYQGERVHNRLLDLAKEFDSELIFQCDAGSNNEITQLFIDLNKHWDGFDGFVHAIGFCSPRGIGRRVFGWLQSRGIPHSASPDISAYSFPAMAKAALPIMEGRNASLLTLNYLSAVRTMSHYNVMGMAKASLEASVRYLAMQLGKQEIRVNGISAGPVKTLAAAGIADFNKLLSYNDKHAPLKRNLAIEEVGNAAAFLCSDLASGSTGEIIYVDGGFNITALGTTET